MKILFNEIMEVVTPCFCAGADQSKAEIRAPSIRGELRWWFRALGGTLAEEQKVFGGIAGDEGTSSAVVVRVLMLPPQKDESRHLPENHQFFTMSRKGNEAMIPAGRRFMMKILLRRSVDTERLNLAIEAFMYFGSIGLRSNRGCGALQRAEHLPSQAEVEVLFEEMRKSGFECFSRAKERDGLKALKSLEDAIKTLREDCNIQKNEKNAMGFVGSTRHSSCLRVRPVALKDGFFLPVLLYSESVKGEDIKGIRMELKACFS
ncbi:MAG: type III-B CRISPR module RAMP protein Cmr1 [Pontiella sp.]